MGLEMPLDSELKIGKREFFTQTLRNDGNGFGFTLSGWELTFGFQSHMNQDWILGFAGSYVEDTLQYNLGGHGDMTGVLQVFMLSTAQNIFMRWVI